MWSIIETPITTALAHKLLTMEPMPDYHVVDEETWAALKKESGELRARDGQPPAGDDWLLSLCGVQIIKAAY
jgi:hypothetical protein